MSSQKKFDDKYTLQFPLLSDPEKEIAKAYGAFGVKNMYGKKKEGIIRSSFLIDEKGAIVDAWYKVKPDATVPSAIAALSPILDADEKEIAYAISATFLFDIIGVLPKAFRHARFGFVDAYVMFKQLVT